MAEIPATRASLLVRLRDPRDEAAWTEFVDLYGPLVNNYARKQGLQDADAADREQEVLLTVVKPANIPLSFSRDAKSSERSASSATRIALRSEDFASRLNKVVVKITEFGLARMVDDVALTQPGVVAGAPEHMAPEQAPGESVDHRTHQSANANRNYRFGWRRSCPGS